MRKTFPVFCGSISSYCFLYDSGILFSLFSFEYIWHFSVFDLFSFPYNFKRQRFFYNALKKIHHLIY
ncbi:hypothetical protein A8C56_02655 [Niabella ginsenosidivorans]|uniref:Uncharacterized protein n=1 Tax=Niabella ginsenosidivorans TaxID=1176587 RepID=A0A1A9HY71_9BACT|nr:hypothetical protein A8C56_02655 [Niabella ginsenosidivorans]